ncbi:hypothetical protein [Amaricoccus solimangrovi]|uniref:hypothetical protein n=1 Tax=Amaricoccus solimangrovi TaxID=2589815 RepID=UPI0015E35E2D|nr:hypothetical protein [Amaricoccus solimangrovi]
MFGNTRLFRCGYCGHHMRLGAESCGACYTTSPFWNRAGFWLVCAATATALVALPLLLL